jgi:hypothetical protein
VKWPKGLVAFFRSPSVRIGPIRFTGYMSRRGPSVNVAWRNRHPKRQALGLQTLLAGGLSGADGGDTASLPVAAPRRARAGGGPLPWVASALALVALAIAAMLGGVL